MAVGNLGPCLYEKIKALLVDQTSNGGHDLAFICEFGFEILIVRHVGDDPAARTHDGRKAFKRAARHSDQAKGTGICVTAQGLPDDARLLPKRIVAFRNDHRNVETRCSQYRNHIGPCQQADDHVGPLFLIYGAQPLHAPHDIRNHAQRSAFPDGHVQIIDPDPLVGFIIRCAAAHFE